MDFLDQLNPEQKRAVEHSSGPLLVFAGAGSGKTRVITYRIANLIATHNIYPDNILAVTFTKKASEEMKERITSIFGELGFNTDILPTIGTFHSICAQILRSEGEVAGLGSNFSIYDSDDSEGVIKELMLADDIDIKQFKPKMIYSMIGSAKNDMISSKDYGLHYSGFIEDIVAEIYPKYQEHLENLNAVDFTDLLYRTVLLMGDNPEVLKRYQELYKYILVDEYQDTNKVQYKLITSLSQQHQNLCVVGDDDQSIYKWRGADIKNIISFEKDFNDVTVVKLEQNYRSTNNIITAAVAVIKRNNERVDKSLWTEKGSGDPITVYQARDEKDESIYIANEVTAMRQKGYNLGDMAVLYRTNYQSRVIEEAMIQKGIPYKLVGGFRFYERKEIKDILSYLRFINNPKDDVSLFRILNVPARKMGPKSIASLVKLARSLNLSSGNFLILSHILLNLPDVNPLDHGFDEANVKSFDGIYDEVGKFSTLINLFGGLYISSYEKDVVEMINEVLAKTKYIEFMDDGTDAANSRKENIQELKNVASTFVNKNAEKSLSMFLQNIALIEQEQEKNKKDISDGSITLMTLHSSKGLEFPIVFMPGVEEGILPHSRTFTDPTELEEERRLCYVGITRAKEKLWMSFADGRSKMGGFEEQIPSRFLGEIPQDLCEYYSYSY
jgi:DNA helicase-2/ATP-dependent DNA helicase PcrA